MYDFTHDNWNTVEARVTKWATQGNLDLEAPRVGVYEFGWKKSKVTVAGLESECVWVVHYDCLWSALFFIDVCTSSAGHWTNFVVKLK